MILSDNIYTAKNNKVCAITGNKINIGNKYMLIRQYIDGTFSCITVCRDIINDYFWMLDAFGNLIDEYRFDKEMYFDILKDE